MILLLCQTHQLAVSLCSVFFAMMTKFILLVLLIVLLLTIILLVSLWICYINWNKQGMLIKLKRLDLIFNLHFR